MHIYFQHPFCFRFLATGNSFRSIGFNFRLGFSTVREIVKEVCDAIWNRLGPIVMPPPTEDTWKSIAAKYKTMWHFLNCIGAIDGKHINIQCPIIATYYNYKGGNSIVLLALVDAVYKFIAIDGSYGRNSDGGIFSQSVIGQKLNNKTLKPHHPPPLLSEDVGMRRLWREGMTIWVQAKERSDWCTVVSHPRAFSSTYRGISVSGYGGAPGENCASPVPLIDSAAHHFIVHSSVFMVFVVAAAPPRSTSAPSTGTASRTILYWAFPKLLFGLAR